MEAVGVDSPTRYNLVRVMPDQICPYGAKPESGKEGDG